MIIGSGLIAKAFSIPLIIEKNVCVFASGVSNSNCEILSEFNREKELLLNSLISFQDSLFLYFSTCSINSEEMSQSQYIRHKLHMESLVKTHKNFLIVRLPQVAGITNNQNTLLNYLASKIQSNQPFELWVNAYRNIIDISDVVKIVVQMIEDENLRNRIVNVANPISHKIIDIVYELESLLASKSILKTVSKGEYISIDLSITEKYINLANIQFSDNYLNQVLKKYFSKSF